MFGIISALAIASYMYSIPIYRILRSKVKNACRTILLGNLTSWLSFLCIMVEQGHFQSATVFRYISNLLIMRFQIQLALLYSTPVYAMLRLEMNRVKSKLMAIEIANAFLQLIGFIALIVYARYPDPSVYNSICVLLMFVLGTLGIGAIVMMIIFAMQLRKAVSNLASKQSVSMLESRKRQLERLTARLARIEKEMGLAALSFTQFYIMSGVILGLGSVPGQYIVIFVMHVSVPYFTYQASRLLRSEEHDAFEGADVSRRGPSLRNDLANNGGSRLDAV